MFFGLQIMVLAGIITGISNYFLKKSIEAGGSSRIFLMLQLTITFFAMILLNPIRSGNFFFSMEMASLGLIAGFILGIMMISLGKAFEYGPAGLTSAMLNASTLFPILGMVTLFGKQFGFEYTISNGVGSVILLLGLFWAGYETFQCQSMRKWFVFAMGAFVLHIVYLSILQYRFVLLHFPGQALFNATLSVQEAASEWFMPMTFFSAAAVQIFSYLRNEYRALKAEEIRLGVIGGVCQGVGAFCMISATELATPVEQAMIFPIFSITIVLVCNIWGRFLYREQVRWRAIALSLAGLTIGTLNWNNLFAYFGATG